MTAQIVDLTDLIQGRAALAAQRQGDLDTRTAALVADFGRPDWPGWRWLILLLLLLQLAVAAQQALGQQDPLRRAGPGRAAIAKNFQQARVAGTTPRLAAL